MAKNLQARLEEIEENRTRALQTVANLRECNPEQAKKWEFLNNAEGHKETVKDIFRCYLKSQYQSLENPEEGKEVLSYIGNFNNKTYIITPIKGNSTNELAYELGVFLKSAIEKGKMQLNKAGHVLGTGATKWTGTPLEVDNTAPVTECQVNPKVNVLEVKDYLVLEIESEKITQEGVRDYFYNKFTNSECKPRALTERGMNYKIEKIGSEELGYFLSN